MGALDGTPHDPLRFAKKSLYDDPIRVLLWVPDGVDAVVLTFLGKFGVSSSPTRFLFCPLILRQKRK